MFQSYSRRSSHDEMYQVDYAWTNVYKYSYFPTTVYMWNTLISNPLSFTSVLQNRRHSVFITDTDSRDHRPQCVILGSSRDALYWKMKMSRNRKHKTTCWTCLQIPQRSKQSVVLLRGTHPPSRRMAAHVCKKLNHLKLHIQSTNRKRFYKLRLTILLETLYSTNPDTRCNFTKSCYTLTNSYYTLLSQNTVF